MGIAAVWRKNDNKRGHKLSRTTHLHIGFAAIVFSAFLFLFGIPQGVSAPDDISEIVLSPKFWPLVLAGVLALGGVGMVLASRNLNNEDHEGFLNGIDGAKLRLGLMAILMFGYVTIAPVLGLVWTSMIAFVLYAFLIKTHHRVAAGIAGVLAPLVLYAFFAHVAGVAVPQGDFVRLP